MGKRGSGIGSPRQSSGRLHNRPKVVTLPLGMASDFEKWVLEKTLTAEVADCLLHEAHEKIAIAPFEENSYDWVYQAFVNLGLVKGHLADRFEGVKRDLYEKARWKFFCAPHALDSLQSLPSRLLVKPTFRNHWPYPKAKLRLSGDCAADPRAGDGSLCRFPSYPCSSPLTHVGSKTGEGVSRC